LCLANTGVKLPETINGLLEYFYRLGTNDQQKIIKSWREARAERNETEGGEE